MNQINQSMIKGIRLNPLVLGNTMLMIALFEELRSSTLRSAVSFDVSP